MKFSSKKSLISIVLLVVILGGVIIGCDDHRHNEVTEEKTSYAKVYMFFDGLHKKCIGYEVFTLSNYTSSQEDSGIQYRVTQTKVDPKGKLFAPNPVQILDLDGNPIDNRLQQCGTYKIEVSENGVMTRISNLEYSGEATLPVARGIGWSMYISRENWSFLR